MYHLKNCNEDIVTELADKYIAETDMCKCEKCRLDVIAYALNQLPPAYVVTTKGEIFASIDSTFLQNRADAIAAVAKGVKLVSQSPKHD
ncbi:MAG: competence protein ComFB [Clostridiales bacterium]|jgi:competence protein ComFB|nr:competence protein ComFB [Clostridiales bacterium]